jgi:hypothetical protein
LETKDYMERPSKAIFMKKEYVKTGHDTKEVLLG